MKPLLNILILHTPDRQDFLRRLNAILDPQLTKDVKVLIDDSRYKKIGRKRNELMARADGKYIAFIDDDDRISDKYIQLLMQGIKKDVDCCSLRGVITEDGKRPFLFEHSIKYSEYRTNEDVVMDLDMLGWNQQNKVRYERYPNHLNCVKREIAKQFPFPETNHGEDTDYATQMFKAGVLKTEYEINETIYYYDYISRK
jgi:glycosyltransferase involved in cell wall biosynthesis